MNIETYREKISVTLKRKKGFTLAELVVVIGILAILAAIAVPFAIGIIASAADSVDTSDAEELSKACKSYYTMICTGQIDSTDFAGLPSPSATARTRKASAKKITVVDVCRYSDMTNVEEKIKSGSNVFAYDSATGNIYDAKSHPALTTYVTDSLNLGTLYTH